MIARIKSQSYIARDWRGRNHVGGNLEHVHFRWDGKHYVSGELTPVEHQRVQHNPNVEIEVTTISLPDPEPAVISDDELFGPTDATPRRGRGRG